MKRVKTYRQNQPGEETLSSLMGIVIDGPDEDHFDTFPALNHFHADKPRRSGNN